MKTFTTNDENCDAGLKAVVLIARFHGLAADPDMLRHQAGLKSQVFSEIDLLKAAKTVGLKARTVKVSIEKLATTPLPCLALHAEYDHFLILGIEAARVLIHDPVTSKNQFLSYPELETHWTGRVILFASRASLVGELARFDFTWFIPAVIKYRRLLLEVLAVSLVLQLFALVTPLFFQVVMDKVLVHRGLTTLNLICIGLLVTSIFEILLTGIRTYVFAHTTNRIDVELGAKLYRHMLALPLAYFGARRVGDTVARVRELESIRSFLTGQAMTVVLDVFFSVIFLAVMWFYSVKLTIIVMLSLPCYVLISALLVPPLRVRLNEKFARGADNQSYLVESISGIETVKAMAVEPQFTQHWDRQLSSYVTAEFRVSSLANIGQQAIQLIGKIVTVVTLWLGAQLMIDGKLTVGMLIAFNMLAGRVAAPILRLAQLWQDFQQVGISMQRLGDVLNTRTEIPQSRQTLPALKGDIAFDKVRFRYTPSGSQVLTDIELRINAGETIGIVGRSGSGKSTLAKLLQRLYVPEAGAVRIDGIDLALADPAWLRRQVGVVLQDNLLFNRSIRENIALTDPAIPLDQVIHAAKLAGAHDFILELAECYDTKVGEHGSSLSGGQRQRIAIARALISNPRILIFDEATSALDYESERTIQDNMQAICAGRTVIIIAHRLSAVRLANRIVTMDKGQIIEVGNHDELMRSGGYYARLVELQGG